MRKAKKKPLSTWLLFQYVHHLYRRHFYGIVFSGAVDLLQDSSAYPALFFGNHESWWDGLLEISLMRYADLDYYVMMEQANLDRFSFFNRCGVYGVDLTSARDGARALRYTVDLLRSDWQAASSVNKRCVFMYPEGKIRPPGGEALPLQGGLSRLQQWLPEVTFIPVYKKIFWWKYPLPVAVIELGQPYKADSAEPAPFEALMEATKNSLNKRLEDNQWQDAVVYYQSKKDLHGMTNHEGMSVFAQ